MNKILIIGNGFDLNLGIASSYADFLTSGPFKKLIEENNFLASFLHTMSEQSQPTDVKWVDIEHELKAFCTLLLHSKTLVNEITKSSPWSIDKALHLFNNQNAIKVFILKILHDEHKNDSSARSQMDFNQFEFYLNASVFSYENKPYYDDIKQAAAALELKLSVYFIEFKKEFVALKEALSEHLIKATDDWRSTNKNTTYAFHLLRHGNLFDADKQTLHLDFNAPVEGKSSFTQAFSFNYTNTLGLTGFTSTAGAETQLHYMHGSLGNNNIVFGVEDGAVDNKFLFLAKSAHAAFGEAPDLSPAMIAAEEIHFFGCSLGDTDNAHFQHPFTELSHRNTSDKKRKIVFYVYGKDGYQNTIERILFLTDGRLSEFKITNEVIFFDLKEEKVIDQAWLNH